MTGTDDRLGIVELVGLCETMRRRNSRLFEVLGGWVATTTDATLQRLLAEACHRHAWHANLWSDRRPTIPVASHARNDAPLAVESLDERSGEPDARRDAYRADLDALRADVDRLRARTNPIADPSTTRLLTLVRRDLDDLLTGLD